MYNKQCPLSMLPQCDGPQKKKRNFLFHYSFFFFLLSFSVRGPPSEQESCHGQTRVCVYVRRQSACVCVLAQDGPGKHTTKKVVNIVAQVFVVVVIVEGGREE